MHALIPYLAELPVLFGTHFEYRGNSTEFEWEVADLMQGMSTVLLTYLGNVLCCAIAVNMSVSRALAIVREESI